MQKLSYLIIAACVAFCSCVRSGESTTTADDNTPATGMPDPEAAPVSPADTFSFKGYDMIAKILAGKQPGDSGFMHSVTSSKAFNTHSARIQAAWQSYCRSYRDPIRRWGEAHLPMAVDTVFYPFGGPDFNYLASFFPDTRFSVQVGIEQPGSIPFATPTSQARADSVLTILRESVRTNMQSSFFRTKSMAKDLYTDLQGTLPVVMMFMSLHGYELITINPVAVNESGEIAYTDPDRVWAHSLDKKFGQGYEIMYRLPGENGVRKFTYLGTDLSNSGFTQAHLDKMTRRYFNGQTTFLKAASYLLDSPGFTHVADAILDNSALIVTGPSGMPYSKLDKSVWDITLFGDYKGPISLFALHPQDDLKEAYKTGSPIPIDFRFDYDNNRGFIMARKRAH